MSLEHGRLRLGDNVHFGEYANIRAGDSFIEIGDNLLASQFVSLIAANHLIGEGGVPDRERHDLARHGITIDDDCWLGAQCVLLPGVELGARCIVGAGAIVTRSFPDGSRIVGNPARAL